MAHLDYINRSNLDYIETLFQKYLSHPDTISSEWRIFFNGMELAQGQISISSLEKEVAVFRLISAYRQSGHLKAKLNPLQNALPIPSSSEDPFHLSQFSLSEADLGKTFQMSAKVGLKPHQTLKDILAVLKKTYCDTLSLQVESCPPDIQKWFFNEFENSQTTILPSNEQKKNIVYKLAKVEALEKFLHSRFVGAKRFSIEGGDVLIPMLDYMVEAGTQKHIKEVVVGMAHRGRLNVLNNFMNKSKKIVFMEFDGSKALEHFDFEGDVKYHMGYSSVKKIPDGASCNILLTYNPSHLEAVNSVVCGITRARQRVLQDQHTRKSVLPVLIHGDAAFCGQGCVSETLQLSQLDGFTTGGSLHIILNNQIGFTTNPLDSRSSLQASDLSKSIQAPTLLVERR